MEHTPGPWKVIDGRIFSETFMTKGPIATVHRQAREAANARLIALSPKMLGALEAFLAIDTEPRFEDESDASQYRGARFTAQCIIAELEGRKP